MKLTHKNLHYLLALDRQRNYGRAAESLGISQPALSRAILALEKRLGVTIFERSRHGVTPTEAGRLLLRHAADVTLLASEVEAGLSELKGRVHRKLSVVCGHYPAELTVPVALSALVSEWPGLQVNMEVADWSRGIQLLEQEVCDLGVIELSATSQKTELNRELLSDRRVFPVVRAGHPLARKSRPALRDVLEWPWACSQIPARAATYLGSGPLAAGDFDAQTGNFVPKIVASSLSTSLRLVSESDIVGIAPLSAAEPFLECGSLCLVPLDEPWMRLNYGFVWERSRPLTAATRAFMDKVREIEQQERQRERALLEKWGIAPG